MLINSEKGQVPPRVDLSSRILPFNTSPSGIIAIQLCFKNTTHYGGSFPCAGTVARSSARRTYTVVAPIRPSIEV